MTPTPSRGQVYWADLGYGRKPWLVVSNNSRNRVTADVLAVRISTTARELPTWVRLKPNDPVKGYVNADNIETLGKDELGEYAGALSPDSMLQVNKALCIALGIP